MLFLRLDKVITVCEIKFKVGGVGTEILKEMENKLAKLVVPRGWTLERAIIAPFGVDQSVKQLEYFHHIIEMEDLLNVNTL